MLIQWHLLMARLQQSDEAYESLAADMGAVGTQSAPPTAKTSQSGIALKKLHHKLGNRGFQQFVEMKQASLLAKAAYTVASKPQTKNEIVEELQADIKAPQGLDSNAELQEPGDKDKDKDKDIFAQAEQGAQVVSSDKEPSGANDKVAPVQPQASTPKVIPIRSYAANDLIIPSLLIAFKQSLPIPSNKLWQRLEKHYLQLQSRQQAKLVSSLSGLLKGVLNKQLKMFLDSIKELSSLHVVQAVLAKILPLRSSPEDVVVEIDVPTEPEED